jgi:hypothetical protein
MGECADPIIESTAASQSRFNHREVQRLVAIGPGQIQISIDRTFTAAAHLDERALEDSPQVTALISALQDDLRELFLDLLGRVVFDVIHSNLTRIGRLQVPLLD